VVNGGGDGAGVDGCHAEVTRRTEPLAARRTPQLQPLAAGRNAAVEIPEPHARARFDLTKLALQYQKRERNRRCKNKEKLC
jgi:hypothetical protein